VSLARLFVSVIVAAGGQGTRLGAGVPKQWLTLGGRTLVDLSVAAFEEHPGVREIVLVVPAADAVRRDLLPARPAGAVPLRIVGGGDRRPASVANGFAAVSPHADVVLIHDAARPFVTHAVIDRTVAAAHRHGAAIAAVPVHDTVKEVAARDDALMVKATLPREQIFRAQTPQGFRRDVLAAVVARGLAGASATDEAMLAEQAGYDVAVVEGDETNVKITTAGDLARARAAGTAGRAAVRIGLGYDSHRFGEGRVLRLGGVVLPEERGLQGHSDGDAVCHAVTDAVLGALGLGDVGGLFPDTDARWKDADSLVLLRHAWSRVRERGWALGNLDVVVVCERPKIGPVAEAIRRSLAGALAAPPDAVAIKGKTPEGTANLAEALVVHAVALLVSTDV
jgi:2-C-methyl-D-erythritol 4-phosphate cytidylyltransferase/2-C-methyl-D-erythritol 2,4-cyclodiphosphate synthase